MKAKKGGQPRAGDPELDRLAELVRGVSPERLRSLLAKGSVVNFRVSETDKTEIAATASALGLTMAEYFLRLHYLAADLLSKSTARERKD